MEIENISNWQMSLSQSSSLHGSEQLSSGSFHGLNIQVTASDSNSSLANSCEELTFSKDNDQETKLADRKQKANSNKSTYLERLQKVLRREDSQLKQEQTSKLKAFLMAAQHDQESINKFLQNLYSASHNNYAAAYAFLLEAQEQSTSPEEQNLLKRTCEQFYSQNQGQIDAQCNALDVLYQEENSLELSQLYGDLTEGNHDELSLVEHLVKLGGESKLSDEIQNLFKALANDLASATKSHEDTVLHDVASTLTKAMTLNGGLKLTSEFLGYVQNQLSITPKNLDASMLLVKLLRISQQNFISPQAVHDIYRSNIIAADPEQAVVVGQAFFKMLRQSAPNLYAQDEDRLKLINASQQLLDQLIDAEDEWLDSLEQ